MAQNDMVNIIFDKVLTDDVETIVIALALYRQALASAMPAQNDAVKSCDRAMGYITASLAKAGRLQIIDRARARIR